jgi:hypothetical protein
LALSDRLRDDAAMKLSSIQRPSSRRHGVIGSYVAMFLTVAIWYRTLLAEEEEEEDGGVVGSAHRSRPVLEPAPVLEPHQQVYLDGIDRKIRLYSGLAVKRLTRFRLTSAAGLVAALLVPVAVAAGAPSWAAAGLGAMAAISQGLQQILQDQRYSVEAHALAVGLSRARRTASYTLGNCTTKSAQRRAFDSFVEHVEDITGAGDERLIGVLRSGSATTSSPDRPPEARSEGERTSRQLRS